MLAQLDVSGYLDAVEDRLVGAWSDVLDRAACEDAVGEAVEALYFAVRAGKAPRKSIEAFIWGTARNKVVDENERRKLLLPASESIPAPEEAEGLDEPSADTVRREAIRVARRFLPKLGQDRIVRVMEMIIDGVEAQVHVSNEEIADALGLSNDVVRKSRERGFTRLRARVQEAGEALTREQVLALEEEEGGGAE